MSMPAHPLPNEPMPHGLSPRECAVMRRVASGWTNRAIAGDLSIQLSTVDRYVLEVFRKWGMHSREEAAARFRQLTGEAFTPLPPMQRGALALSTAGLPQLFTPLPLPPAGQLLTVPPGLDPSRGPCLAEALQLYCAHHLRTYARAAGTIRLVERVISRLPNVPLADLRRLQVMQWHQRLGAQRRIVANVGLDHLRLLFRKMTEWEMYEGKDATRYVKCFERRKRKTVVPAHRMPDLLAAIQRRPLPQRLYYLTVVLCGCRRGEALHAEWADLDLTSGVWTIPATKNGDLHRLHLPADLVALYRTWHGAGRGPYIFSEDGAKPWGTSTVERYWQQIRATVGLEEICLHDLRRTLISTLCQEGKVNIAQMIANHKSRSTTEGYWIRGASTTVTDTLADYAARLLQGSSTNGDGPEKGR